MKNNNIIEIVALPPLHIVLNSTITAHGEYRPIDPFIYEIPAFMKIDTLNARRMSSWTEQEIMEYAFITGQGWTL